MFLTKAEQRAQEKKTDKKAAEDPFSFLVDVRDVSYFKLQIETCMYIVISPNVSLRVEVHAWCYAPIRRIYALHPSSPSISVPVDLGY